MLWSEKSEWVKIQSRKESAELFVDRATVLHIVDGRPLALADPPIKCTVSKKYQKMCEWETKHSLFQNEVNGHVK